MIDPHLRDDSLPLVCGRQIGRYGMTTEATTAELLDAAMVLVRLQARLLHGTGSAAEFTQAATLRDELEQATRSGSEVQA